MNLRCWFDSFRLEKIKLNAGVLATDVAFDRPNQDAAWELYVEMLTRVVTPVSYTHLTLPTKRIV